MLLTILPTFAILHHSEITNTNHRRFVRKYEKITAIHLPVVVIDHWRDGLQLQ
jgi:hypothetical protein